MNRNHAEAVSRQLSRLSHREAATPRLTNGTSTQQLCGAESADPSQKQRSYATLILTAAFALVLAATGTVQLTGPLFRLIQLHSATTPLAPAPGVPAPPTTIAAAPAHQFLPKLHPLAGLASWYGSVWNGRKTASGETYDETQLTAAHRTLPLGTLVRVTNLRSMQSVIVRINDRGAFSANRIIDLSSAAATKLGMMEQGLERVRLDILGKNTHS